MAKGTLRIALALVATLCASGAWAGEIFGSSTADELTQGLELSKTQGEELAARELLSHVVFSSDVTPAQQTQAVKALRDLSAKTILSSTVLKDDPVAYSYTVKAKDTLASVSKRCGCPAEILQQINDMKTDALQVGSTIKLLRGPFRAQIDKSQCVLDVYLKDATGAKTFVYRARVAVGRNDGTPEGLFRIAGKAEKATWNPPTSMKDDHPDPVKWGEKGYPLGKDGLFMRLAGAEPKTSKVKGYGIHSTNSQGSIGHPRSHGCVRVGDKDIRNLYTMLDVGSEVQIIP